MGSYWQRKLYAACAGIFLAARLLAVDTNSAAGITRDEITSNYLHIQEQLRAAQIAIEQNQATALETSQSNAVALSQRLQSLEQAVADQRHHDDRTQQSMFLMAGIFGLLGLGILLLMVYFQWRAFAQLARIAARQPAALVNGDAVHGLAAPGRAAVEASTTQLRTVVGRLEQRIKELENGQKLLPASATATPQAPAADLLSEGQMYLDANAPQKALECFDQFLHAQPGRTDAWVRRSAALEKLGRDDEALAGYNRAIAADPTLVIAHLHKGGLLNRLRRYDEALNCYEQALLGQDKRAKV
jgi:tetratricopeptide (TPR) repeat protein